MAYNAIHGLTGDALIAGQKHGYQLLYWGSIILGLGNGSAEAYCNPIVATMFSTDKTKWLNRLHAGWPGGLVLGGLCTIALAANTDWRMIVGLDFNSGDHFLSFSSFENSEERTRAGWCQLPRHAQGTRCVRRARRIRLGVCATVAGLFRWTGNGLGVWIPRGGRFLCRRHQIVWPLLLAFLIVVMMPQATTELGTNGWITSLMQTPMQATGHNPAWVLVYTSAIMLILRFCAGPLIHKFSPPGLLATCSALAALGIFALSKPRRRGHCHHFCRRNGLWHRHNFLLADDSRPDFRAMPERRRAHIERDGRHRHVGGRNSWLAVHRLHAGKLHHQTAASRQSRALSNGHHEKKISPAAKYEAIDPVKSAANHRHKRKPISRPPRPPANSPRSAKWLCFPILTDMLPRLDFYFKSRGGYKPVQLASK